jgi:hypothetical protein
MLCLFLVYRERTNNVAIAERLLASVFFFPNVINFSASLCASFALCHDVEMDSCSMRDVTRLRSSALRWAESLLKCRYLVRPPAIVAVRGRASFHVWSRVCRSVGFGVGVKVVSFCRVVQSIRNRY